VWRPLQREGIVVAQCTLVRWMRALGLHGAVRGLRVRTTTPEATLACPSDRVSQGFQAPRPNALWRADLTYVATRAGCVYAAFVIDADARRIVGGRVSNSLRTDLALDVLDPALYVRTTAQGCDDSYTIPGPDALRGEPDKPTRGWLFDWRLSSHILYRCTTGFGTAREVGRLSSPAWTLD